MKSIQKSSSSSSSSLPKVDTELEIVKKIKSDRVKKSLINFESCVCSFDRDGISSKDYHVLMQSLSFKKMYPSESVKLNQNYQIHEDFKFSPWLSLLWKENEEYLRGSLEKFMEFEVSSSLFSQILNCLSQLSDSRLAYALKKFEEAPVWFTRILRDLIFSQTEGSTTDQGKINELRLIFKCISSSEILVRMTADLLCQLHDKLTDEILGEQLGEIPVKEHIERLRANNPLPLPGQSVATWIRHRVLDELGIPFYHTLGLEKYKGQKLIGEKELGLVFGDMYIRGSSFDGYSFKEAAELMCRFKSLLSEDLARKLDTVAYILEKKIIFGDSTKEKLEKIYELINKHKSVAIPAGWVTQTGGHAMVAEVMLNEDETATVRLYNQGGGVGFHREHRGQFRNRRDAYLEKTSIPAKIVFSQAFWVILLGMQDSSQRSNNESIKASDLYEWFIHVLPGKISEANVQILPQRSGTCTFKSLLALIKAHMTEEEYDKFILQFKFGVLALYEENLYFRQPDLVFNRRGFVREVRQKLKESVEMQFAIGSIDETRAQLLKKYCETDLELISDTSTYKEPEKLTSIFKVSPPVLGREISDVAGSHNRYWIFNSPLIPKTLFEGGEWCQVSGRDDIIKALKNLQGQIFISDKTYLNEKYVYIIQEFISYMPSLVEVEELMLNLEAAQETEITASDFDYVIKLLKIIKDSKSNFDVPKSFMHAWLSVFANICARSVLKKYQLDLFFSSLPGGHSLESSRGYLYSSKEPLNAFAQRLLKDWIAYREKTKDKASDFEIGLKKNPDNTIIQLRSKAVDLDFMKRFGNVCKPRRADFETMISSKSGAWRLAAILFGHCTSLDDLNCFELYDKLFLLKPFEIIFDQIFVDCGYERPSKSFNYRLNRDVLEIICPNLPPKQNAAHIYRLSLRSTTTESTLPFIGIENQLSAIEADPELIPFYKPEINWFRLSMIHKDNGLQRGVSLGEAYHIGATPLQILLSSGAANNVLERLTALCQGVFERFPNRSYLCEPLLKLVAQLNLMTTEEQCIELDVSCLDSSANPSLEPLLAQYHLSLSENKVDKPLILYSLYYLRIYCGLEQRGALLSSVAGFMMRYNVQEVEKNVGEEVSEEIWQRAVTTVLKDNPFGMTVDKDGVPYIDGVFQLSNTNWRNSTHGKMLVKLFGHIEFGPWKTIDVAINDKSPVVRCWEGIDDTLRIMEQSDSISTLCSGGVLIRRLESLDLKVSPKIESNTLYELHNSSKITGIPDGLKQAHIEYWHPLPGKEEQGQSKEGWIIDPVNRKFYVVEKNIQNKKNEHYRISDIDGKKLLTGTLKGSRKLFVTWEGLHFRVPNLGHSTVPVEIWGKGKGKKLDTSLVLMNGRLSFKIKRVNDRLEYFSEDFKGFKWDPNLTNDDLGHLNGLYLTNNEEEILLIPPQAQRMTETVESSLRPIWDTKIGQTYSVLRRRIRPHLERNDPNQTLFVNDNPSDWALILQELIFQRSWDRAWHYASLITFNIGSYAKHKLEHEMLFQSLLLDHPMAQLIRLRIVAMILPIVYDAKKIYPQISQHYKEYIQNYHLFPHLRCLKLSEELILAEKIDPSKTNNVIQNHISRVKSTIPNYSRTTSPVKIEIRGLDEDSETNLVSNGNEVYKEGPLKYLYRPQPELKVFVNMISRLMLKGTVDERLIQTALLWNSIRNGRVSWKKRIAPMLSQLIAKAEAPLAAHNSAKMIRELIEEINAIVPENTSEQKKPEEWIDTLENHLKALQITSNEEQVVEMEVISDGEGVTEMDVTGEGSEDTRSRRHKERESRFNTTIMRADQISESVKQRLSEFSFPQNSQLNRKRPAEVTESPKPVKRFRTDEKGKGKQREDQVFEFNKSFSSEFSFSQNSQSSRKRQVETAEASTSNKRAKLDVEDNGQVWASQSIDSSLSRMVNLERDIEEITSKQERVMESLKPIFSGPTRSHGAVGLSELFTWLENLEGEPGNLVERKVAALLVKFAQYGVELSVKKSALVMIKDGQEGPEVLNRLLNCTTILDRSIERKIRYRLAAFMWRHEIALRDYQLKIICQANNSQGLLAQVDCGGGKSHVITPGIINTSEQLVLNVVPSGIVVEHARRLSAESSSRKEVPTIELRLTRSEMQETDFKLMDSLLKNGYQRLPVVTTVSDMASYHLAYFWALLHKESNSDKGKLLTSVVQNMKKSCTLLLDEIDTAAKEQIHWTIGRKQTMSPFRKRSTGILFERMLKIDLEHNGELFCLIHKDQKNRFSSERYWNEGLPLLLQQLIETDEIFEFIPKDQIETSLLSKYLLCKKGGDGWVDLENRVDKLAENYKNCIKWLRTQFQVYLPHTLKMRYNVHYGPKDSKSGNVVPYKSAKVPDPKGQYIFIDILGNLTLQGVLRTSPSYQDVSQLINCKIKPKEMERAPYFANRWLGTGGTVGDLTNIVERKGNWQELLTRIQNNPFVRFDIGFEFRLAKLEYHSKVLRFTFATLTAGAAKLIGISASLSNSAGMNELLAENLISTDAYETSRKCLIASTMKELSDVTLNTIKQIAADGASALSDPSALLVDYECEELVEAILEGAAPSIRHVVFWDVKSDRLLARDRMGYTEPYSPYHHRSEACFFYLDQARSRGTDLPLAKDCVMVVLVGVDCTFTELKQAAERCRWYKEGLQKVSLYIEKMPNPTSEKLLNRIDKNERKMYRDELVLMARREIFEVCCQRLKETIWEKPEETDELVKLYSSLLIHTIDQDTCLQLASLAPPPNIKKDLEDYAEKFKKDYEALLNDKDRASINGYLNRVLKALGNDQAGSSEAVLDLTAEVVHHADAESDHQSLELDFRAECHQQTVRTEAHTENAKKVAQEIMLWDPKVLSQEFIEKIQSASCGALKWISFQGISKERIFVFHKLQSFYPLLKAPESVYISSLVAEKKLQKIHVNEIEKCQNNKNYYKIIQKVDCILSFLQINQERLDIGLTEREGDLVVQHLRRANLPPYSLAVQNVALYKINGSLIAEYPINALPALSAEIRAIFTVFNGVMGQLDPADLRCLSGGIPARDSRLAYLKLRLSSHDPSESLHFTNNPLVKELESLEEANSLEEATASNSVEEATASNSVEKATALDEKMQDDMIMSWLS